MQLMLKRIAEITVSVSEFGVSCGGGWFDFCTPGFDLPTPGLAV